MQSLNLILLSKCINECYNNYYVFRWINSVEYCKQISNSSLVWKQCDRNTYYLAQNNQSIMTWLLTLIDQSQLFTNLSLINLDRIHDSPWLNWPSLTYLDSTYGPLWLTSTQNMTTWLPKHDYHWPQINSWLLLTNFDSTIDSHSLIVTWLTLTDIPRLNMIDSH